MLRAARVSGAGLLVLWLWVAPAYPDGLVFLGLQRDGVGGVDGLLGADSVAVGPDGAHVYVTGADDDAVAVFARDPATGALTFVEVEKDGVGGVEGLNGVRSVAVSPDGAHVYAASFLVDAVAVFARDPVTGVLAFVEARKGGVGGVDGLAGAVSVAVSPDGAHVYVAGATDDAVAVFARDPLTGKLTFVEARKDGVGGVDGLAGARSVTVSPDGTHVYVAGAADDAVAVFARDPVTGALAFVEVPRDGVGGVDGLDRPTSVTVSPDGAHVYVAGADDEAVAVFVRDPATGALAFVEAPRNGVGGVEGLANALSVTVSPDGARVYVAGNADRAVAVFARDPVTGTLAFVEAQRDGVGGVDGLEGASGVTVSPDGAHVYVASVEEDAVAVFRQITCGDGHLDAGEACEDGNRRAGDCCSPVCQRDAPGTACTDDGNACTADVCDAGGACGVPTPGLPCSDDGNGCTADVCDTVGACGHVAAPAVDCFGATARGGRFVLADRRGAGDRLAWRWRGTTPGRAAAFGDPRGSTAYALCVYSNDPTGGVELALGASVPPGGRCGRRACWQRARGGFAYRDRKGRHAGLRALRLRTGRITVAGRGAQLGLSALPFGADGEVRVQLRRTDGGACWETRFSRAQRGSKLVFRARTD